MFMITKLCRCYWSTFPPFWDVALTKSRSFSLHFEAYSHNHNHFNKCLLRYSQKVFVNQRLVQKWWTGALELFETLVSRLSSPWIFAWKSLGSSCLKNWSRYAESLGVESRWRLWEEVHPGIAKVPKSGRRKISTGLVRFRKKPFEIQNEVSKEKTCKKAD